MMRDTPAHPEQVIGNAFATVLYLKKLGIGIQKRPQAIGSAIVDTLKANGYEIVRWKELDRLRQKAEASPLDWQDMFIRYAKTVGEMAGVDFLIDGDWTQAEWDAIWDAHIARYPQHTEWAEGCRNSPYFAPKGQP
jgi:hypothetical protein